MLTADDDEIAEIDGKNLETTDDRLPSRTF